MVQSKGKADGSTLVIVESPAKARTIEKYLGPGYFVEASVGHVRDLPKKKKELPAKYHKEPWADYAVNVNDDFKPVYVVPPEKAKQVAKLKKDLRNASALYLATDEDREGEAISWHLLETLKPKVPFKRLVFNEITKSAITKALDNTRDLNMNLVKAQEARRVIDRFVGYGCSPILWRKIGGGKSAGRVQSVAVRLIVERERERMAFHSADFWDILGDFSAANSKPFQALLTSVDGRLIPSGKNFDPSTGLLKTPKKFALLDEKSSNELVERLLKSDAVVESIKEKPYTSRPYPPFTTSLLQQDANRKLGFTAKRTMGVAQSLYENGYITYMRTDSTSLSMEAINAARSLVLEHYGDAYLPAKPRLYRTKVKNAQEAHEAIRPAGTRFRLPQELRSKLSFDEFRLYDLIWKRTVASQMADSKGKNKTVVIAIADTKFQTSGKTIEFDGYLRAYVEGTDDPEANHANKESILPDVKEGDALKIEGLTPQKHTTQPSPRYSEASLTKTLEEMGIGRPSTYASIIDVIQVREYAFKKGSALVPTWTAFAVCNLLETHFPELVDYRFTADMENALDEISNGKRDEVAYLRAFYFGDVDDHSKNKEQDEFPFPETFAPGLQKQLDSKKTEIDAHEICQFYIGTPDKEDGTEDAPIYLRVGRYGPYLEYGEVRANIPEDLPPDELTLDVALKFIRAAENSNRPIGYCPETGKAVYLKHGQYGWYVQREALEEGEKPKNVSLIKDMSESDVTLEVALELLKFPKTLGVDPATDEPVVACNGRFGPYVKRGKETRSLSASQSLLTLTLDEAIDLLAQEKKTGRSRSSRKSEPLKTFGISTTTNQEIKLLDGFYGPYVTDGKTNASLPKGVTPDEITSEKALELLAAKMARGSTKGRRTTRKTSEKKTTKKATAKKTTTKKTTAKKSATKKEKKSNSEPPF
ncbi:MAG: type I DNA topoisomerase [Thermoguttaceae bacterium]|jgi:DNA topoisomerase-1